MSSCALLITQLWSVAERKLALSNSRVRHEKSWYGSVDRVTRLKPDTNGLF